MGCGKYGYPGWHQDPAWTGHWGLNPPFHTPVFVLTRHSRPPLEMEGQDVRIGGGATVIREFAAAGLIDHMHIAVVPILLGRGVRVWDGLHPRDDVTPAATPRRGRGV